VERGYFALGEEREVRYFKTRCSGKYVDVWETKKKEIGRTTLQET
jgi:uncharacterized protein YxeA